MRVTLLESRTLSVLAAAALAAAMPPVVRAQAPRQTEQHLAGGGIAQYLDQRPQLLRLTPKQVARVHKLSALVDSLNARERAQWQRLTGGRPLREIPPAERRRLGPRLRPIMERLRVTNEMALDSVDAILTPPQQTRLEALRDEYRRRAEARRARSRQP
jgi:hypothetical protein